MEIDLSLPRDSQKMFFDLYMLTEGIFRVFYFIFCAIITDLNQRTITALCQGERFHLK